VRLSTWLSHVPCNCCPSSTIQVCLSAWYSLCNDEELLNSLLAYTSTAHSCARGNYSVPQLKKPRKRTDTTLCVACHFTLISMTMQTSRLTYPKHAVVYCRLEASQTC
jgi:hypothetical protein